MKIKTFRFLLCLSFLLLAASIFASCNHAHSFGEWNRLREPTCTKQGIERRYCSCGEHESRDIEPLGHTVGEWKVGTDPTCTETGTKVLSCSVCKATLETEIIEAKGHNENGDWIVDIPASCGEQAGESYKICLDCGFECDRRKDILNHLPGAIVTEAEASCTQEGKKSQYCTHCNKLLASLTIPKTNHEYITENGKIFASIAKNPKHLKSRRS